MAEGEVNNVDSVPTVGYQPLLDISIYYEDSSRSREVSLSRVPFFSYSKECRERRSFISYSYWWLY